MAVISLNHISDINTVAKKIIPLISNNKIVAFYGEMGAGKTTLIKAICNEMDIMEIASSPTFSLINEYNTSNNIKIYHFDFYRIKKTEEIYDFGYEEYFYSGDYCFIEWPEKIEQLLPENTMKIKIEVISDIERKIFIE